MNNKKQLQALRNKLQTVCSLSCFVQSSFSFCHWETGKKISATEVNVFREAYFINKFNFNSSLHFNGKQIRFCKPIKELEHIL